MDFGEIYPAFYIGFPAFFEGLPLHFGDPNTTVTLAILGSVLAILKLCYKEDFETEIPHKNIIK